MKKIVLLISLLSVPFCVSAQAPTISLYYGHDKTIPLPLELNKLDTLHLEDAESITIESWADISGRNSHNVILSVARADTLKAYMKRFTSIPINAYGRGEDWITFLSILEGINLPYASNLLIPVRKHIAIDKDNLKDIGKPQIFSDKYIANTLYRNVLPSLRRTDIYVTYNLKEKDPEATEEPKAPAEDSLQEQDPAADSAASSLFTDTITVQASNTVRNIIALRTNLLLPLLNAGLEVPIGKHFSIAGDIYYPWIGYDKANANCLQALLADVQLRWWIRPKKIEGYRGNTLTGSVVSLGAYAGYYDFEKDMKGVQGEIGGLYLDYGYSFYLGTHCRLALSVGLGIARIPYRTYTVYSEGGKLFRDNSFYDINKQWIGPLHAGLVLSIPITGRGK